MNLIAGTRSSRRTRDRACRAFALGVSCAVASSVWAGPPLPGFYQDPGLPSHRATVNHNLDEHIDPFTGMLQIQTVDDTIPGNGGFDLSLRRSYNNPSAVFGTTSDTQSYNRTPNVGVGWNLLIGGRLYTALGAGGACGGGNQMVFETPDGGRKGCSVRAMARSSPRRAGRRCAWSMASRSGRRTAHATTCSRRSSRRCRWPSASRRSTTRRGSRIATATSRRSPMRR